MSLTLTIAVSQYDYKTTLVLIILFYLISGEQTSTDCNAK